MYEEGTIEKDIALAKFDTSKEKFLQGQSVAILVAGGGPSWLYKEIGKDYEKLYGRKFSDDIKVAPIFPCADGKKHYFIDTEAWSESYISSKVDEKKMAAICRLYDFLSSEEGKYLSFCGFEGEDYDIKDGKVVLKEGISLKDKYPYIKGASYICMWDPSSWDMSFPSDTPDEYRQWNVERHKQAVEEGSLPKYYDNVLFLSTPLKDSFVINSKDDLYQVMLGSEPVDKMVDTNIKGFVYIANTIIPLMLATDKVCTIVNIGSVAGEIAYPNGSIYCATKFAVRAISDAMRSELIDKKIKVTNIKPGLVDTEFSLVRFRGDKEKADNVYKGIDPLYAEDIADTVAYIVNLPEKIQITDLSITPLHQANAIHIYKEK